MASVTVTLKNLPAEVHQGLKKRAARHGRSLNGEMIACLRSVVLVEAIDVDDLIAKARAHRAAVRTRLSDHAIRRIKSAGRR
jgi:plasmid stability protein